MAQGGVAPLTVKWADPNLHEKKRKAFGEPTEPQREQTQVPIIHSSVHSHVCPSLHHSLHYVLMMRLGVHGWRDVVH